MRLGTVRLCAADRAFVKRKCGLRRPNGPAGSVRVRDKGKARPPGEKPSSGGWSGARQAPKPKPNESERLFMEARGMTDEEYFDDAYRVNRRGNLARPKVPTVRNHKDGFDNRFSHRTADVGFVFPSKLREEPRPRPVPVP